MRGRIPNAFITDLLTRVDIYDIINARVPLKRAGNEFKACCPFHEEKTPSFTVSRQKQFYHCFGCAAHGTAIGFVMEYDGLEFREAIEELAALYGVRVPEEVSSPDQQQKTESTSLLYSLQASTNRFYRESLGSHADAGRAIDYLRRRKLSAEIIAEYEIGFAPPGWDNLTKPLAGTAAGDLVAAGLQIRNDAGRQYDRFRDRIMFPIKDSRGRTIGFGGRTLSDDTPKYLNSPDTPLFHKGQELYGLYEALQRQRHPKLAVVVEGYMDAIALAQAGINCPVATLGTAPTEEHLRKLLRVVATVVFCFDGDDAGRRAAFRAMEIALPHMRDGRQIGFAFLPEGEDPDSLVREQGVGVFETLLAAATPFSRFLLNKLTADTRLTTAEGRARFVELAKPHVARLPAGVFRELMLSEIANLAQVSRRELDGYLEGRQPKQPLKSPGKALAVASVSVPPLVRMALKLILREPRAGDDLSERDAILTTKLPGTKLLCELLDEFSADPKATAATAIEARRDTAAGELIGNLLRDSSPIWEFSAAQICVEFKDTIKAILRAESSRNHSELTRSLTRSATRVNDLSLQAKAHLRQKAKET